MTLGKVRVMAVLVCIAATALTIVVAPGTAQAASGKDGLITRAEVVARSASWIDDKVPYSQTTSHTNQYGTYRQDCSGYVSMDWNLSSSLTTVTLQPLFQDIPRSDLKPGDALWRQDANTQHIAMFLRWADDAHTRPTVREEADFGEIAKEDTWSASWANTFSPKRYKNIVDTPTDYFLHGDWDGTGKDGVVEVRPEGSTLHWYFKSAAGTGVADFDYTFGSAGDIPVVGDWDGTGGDGIAVARGDGNGGLHWFFKNGARNAAPAADTDAWFGSVGDTPVAGNWDGAGGDGIAVTRPADDGSMHWLFSEGAYSGKTDFETNFGNASDTPVAGNWDGVGGAGIGVARAEADGLHWFTANGPRSTVADGPEHAFGNQTDVPVVGNWGGAGTDGIGAVRAEGSSFHWYLSNSAIAPAETNNFLFG
jgi:hypothetical protein